VVQTPPLGLADAVLRTAHLVRDRLLVLNADEIHINGRQSQAVRYFAQHHLDGLVGYLSNCDFCRIQTGYSVDVDDTNRVCRLTEKPTSACGTNLGVGFWLVSKKIFDFYKKTAFHPLRQERDFVSVIQTMIDAGLRIHGLDLGGHFFNINTPADKRNAEAALMSIGAARSSHVRRAPCRVDHAATHLE